MADLPDTALVRSARSKYPPHWAGQRLAAWDENGFRAASPFIVEKYWSGLQSINVFDVVGTAHPDYQGLTWLEFLEQGKRMRANLLLQESNPGYYLDDAIKQPSMYYIELDGGGWYVNGDGNHRTCIARFFFHEGVRTMLHGVHVESYKSDREAKETFDALQALIASRGLRMQVEPFRKTISRDDTAGWMRERYQVGIRLLDLRRGTEELLTPGEAVIRLERLRKETSGLAGLVRRVFG